MLQEECSLFYLEMYFQIYRSVQIKSQTVLTVNYNKRKHLKTYIHTPSLKQLRRQELNKTTRNKHHKVFFF